MSDESDVISIDIASDTSAGEQVAKALERIATRAYLLDDQLRQGTISFDKYNAEIEILSAQANKVTGTFDGTVDTVAALGAALETVKVGRMEADFVRVGAAAAALDDDFIKGRISLDEYNARFQPISQSAKQLVGDLVGVGQGAAQVFGTDDKFARFEAGMKAIKAEARDLDLAFAQGRIGLAEYEARFESVAERGAKFAASLDAVGHGVRTTGATAAATIAPLAAVGASLDQIGTKAKVNGQQILQMGRLFDDLQYVPQQGLRPIINNVMEVAPAIGIALIAIQSLYSNWDALAGLFGKGAVKTQAEEIEELGKKVSKTAEDYERLARAQRQDRGTEQIANARPEAEKKADAAFNKALGEAGGRQAVAAGIRVVDPAAFQDQPAVAQARKELADLEKQQKEVIEVWGSSGVGYDLTDIDAQLAKAKAKIADAITGTIDEILKQAGNSQDNPGGLARLTGIVQKNPSAFGPNGAAFLASLQEAGKIKSPAEEEEAKEEEFAQKRDQDEQSRQNKLKSDAWEKDEAEDRRQEEEIRKARAAQEQKLADFQRQEAEKLATEDQQAQLKDAQDYDQRHKEDRKRTATVLDGSASLRDSIQQSLAIDNSKTEQTAVEQLAAQREMAGYLKRIAERKVDQTARAG